MSESGYDGWLNKYFDDISGAQSIVELGCGWGADTSFLCGTGHFVTSCDIDSSKLDSIRKRYPGIETCLFDMREILPFDTDSADIFVASLCFQFFTEAELRGILNEIKRVLKDAGALLCRLISEKGVKQGIEGESILAPGLYMTKEGLKQFYNESRIMEVFRDWDIISIEEYETIKKPKRLVVFEMFLQS